MKRFSVLILLIAALSILISCSPDKVQDDSVDVVLLVNENSQRSLTALLDFSISELSWKYTAEKDDGGLATGQKKTETDLESSKALTLSQGYWNFNLYGYKDDSLIAEGSLEHKLVNQECSSITISVQPLQTDKGQGTILIETVNGYSYTVTAYGNNTAIEESSEEAGKIKYTVSSGTYVVKVSSGGTGGSPAYKYINVYDNLTTTVKGEITT